MTQGQPRQTQAPGAAGASNLLAAVRWRCIGPPRGGRVVAVAGDPKEPMVFYFGACAGGVWKTTDGGTYWENVSDGFFKTAAVGAITVAEPDHNVVYAGMGESCIRGDVSYGDGVYKSTDAGKTWVHLGLEDSRHIARIKVHPNDPDLVYVAALGHAFGSNEQRGVFRSRDGGVNWERVLFCSDKAGAIDLCIDPNNPRILYASLWETIRTPWSLTRRRAGQRHFQVGGRRRHLAGADGQPRIAPGVEGAYRHRRLAGQAGPGVGHRRGRRLGVYRSDDGGANWQPVSDNRDIQGRPWYYQHIFADTQDADTVWVLNYQCWKSVDGGKNFE